MKGDKPVPDKPPMTDFELSRLFDMLDPNKVPEWDFRCLAIMELMKESRRRAQVSGVMIMTSDFEQAYVNAWKNDPDECVRAWAFCALNPRKHPIPECFSRKLEAEQREAKEEMRQLEVRHHLNIVQKE